MKQTDCELFFELEAEKCISCSSEYIKVIEKHEFPNKVTRAIKCLKCEHRHTSIWDNKILEKFLTK